MEMPFMGQESVDDFFSGQAAALAGGTTMHIDFALPVDGDLAAGYHAWEKKAEKSCMDYGFHMAVTKWNDGVAKDMEWLVNEKGKVSWTWLSSPFILELKVRIGMVSWSFSLSDQVMCTGINSFKFFMAYKGALMVTDEELLQGFKKCRELGALPQVHAENGDGVVEGQTRMIELGITGPEGHPLSRPPVVTF
jgi:dihydropyrimidinase